MDATAIMALTLCAFLVRAGHAVQTVGSVRARSVADAAIRAILTSASVAILLFLAGRATIALATPGDMGTIEGLAVVFGQPTSFLAMLAAALVPAAIVEGATAERARVIGGTIVAAAVSLVGWTAAVGIGWSVFPQLASAAALAPVWPIAAGHIVGGVAGIAAARSLGARAAKYNRDGSANFIPPHNLTWLVAGALLLTLGLPALTSAIAGDPGARLQNAFVAAAAAAVAAAVVSSLRERRVDAIALLAAVICGAVAGSTSLPELPMLSLVLGAIVGAALPIIAIKLDLKFRVDDPTGLAMIHLLGGIAGTLGASVATARITGQFEWSRLPAGLMTAISLMTIVGFIGVAITVVAALLVKRLGGRVSGDVEAEGVDLALHDINAYPDFQQTMIKSYHLRQ